MLVNHYVHTPRGKRPYGPFSGHSHLLHHQQPLSKNFIETPVLAFLVFHVKVISSNRVFSLTSPAAIKSL